MSLVRMFAKKKKNEKLVSDGCDLEVFKAGTNLQPSTSFTTGIGYVHGKISKFPKISRNFQKLDIRENKYSRNTIFLARENKYTRKLVRLRYV